MTQHGKKYRNARAAIDREQAYTPLEAIKIPKGSGEPHVNKVGTISDDQIREIAERKMPDLNANDIDAAMKIIAGTARQMGIDTEL